MGMRQTASVCCIVENPSLLLKLQSLSGFHIEDLSLFVIDVVKLASGSSQLCSKVHDVLTELLGAPEVYVATIIDMPSFCVFFISLSVHHTVSWVDEWI